MRGFLEIILGPGKKSMQPKLRAKISMYIIFKCMHVNNTMLRSIATEGLVGIALYILLILVTLYNFGVLVVLCIW